MTKSAHASSGRRRSHRGSSTTQSTRVTEVYAADDVARKSDGKAAADKADPMRPLWREYQRTGDEDLRSQLIVHYMETHVRRIASRLHASLPRHVDLEDLVQQGYLGLVDAMDRYDLTRDVKFETFSAQRIYGAIHDYLRRIDPSSRQSRQFFKQIQAAEEAFLKREGRMPADDELQLELRVDTAEFKRMINYRALAMAVSFTPRSAEDGADETDGMAAFEDQTQATPLRDAERRGLRDWLCKGFDRRDKLIIMLYFYDELTMKEVGRTLGISESRVSQRLDSIIQCLRSRLSFNGADQEFIFG